jgi:hypothetical protein
MCARMVDRVFSVLLLSTLEVQDFDLLVLLFRPFVIGSYESGRDHVAGESPFPTLLLFRRLLLCVK